MIGDEAFIVCLPDDLIDSDTPCIAQMLAVHEKYKNSILAVEEVPADQVNQYGIIKSKNIAKNLHQVENLVEKPDLSEAPSRLGIVGRYLLSPDIFKILKETKAGAGGEIQLTDALRELAKIAPMHALEFEGTRYDTGDKLGFIKANLAYGLKRGHFNGNLKDFMRELLGHIR